MRVSGSLRPADAGLANTTYEEKTAALHDEIIDVAGGDARQTHQKTKRPPGGRPFRKPRCVNLTFDHLDIGARNQRARIVVEFNFEDAGMGFRGQSL